jgi:hypothetical protein
MEEVQAKISNKIGEHATTSLHQEPDVASVPENLQRLTCTSVREITECWLKDRTDHESILVSLVNIFSC